MSSVRPPRSRRSLVGLVALLALVLSATACNPGQPPAATVEGTDISTEHIDAIAEAFLEADPEAFAQFEGTGTDTLAMDPYSQILSIAIQLVLQSELAADRDAVPTDEERTAAEDEARSTFLPEEEQTDPAAGPSQAETLNNDIFEALPGETQDWLIDLQADKLALQRVVAEESGSAEEAARTFYDENPAQFTSVCVRLLAVAEADLADVQARLDAGEDFAAVSGEVSVDEQVKAGASGPPNCVPLAQLEQQVQPELYQDLTGADEGGVVGPYPFDEAGTTVALFEVVGQEVVAFEEVRDPILQQLPNPGEQALSTLVQEELAEADVSVDPKFGTWDSEPGLNPQTGQPLPPRVVPPAPPATPAAEPVEGATAEPPG